MLLTQLEPGGPVDTDLDTLATALYVTCDDLLKRHPERVPARPNVGLQPQITDAELLTLAVMQALLGYTSERRWLRHAHARLLGMFPTLPGQSGYNKRLRKLADTMSWLIGVLGANTTIVTDDVWVIDSTRWSAPAPERRSNDPTWPAGLSTVTALRIRGTSGDCACTWCAPCTAYPWAGR